MAKTNDPTLFPSLILLLWCQVHDDTPVDANSHRNVNIGIYQHLRLFPIHLLSTRHHICCRICCFCYFYFCCTDVVVLLRHHQSGEKAIWFTACWWPVRRLIGRLSTVGCHSSNVKSSLPESKRSGSTGDLNDVYRVTADAYAASFHSLDSLSLPTSAKLVVVDDTILP